MWGWGRTGENNKIKFEKYHVPDMIKHFIRTSEEAVVDIDNCYARVAFLPVEEDSGIRV